MIGRSTSIHQAAIRRIRIIIIMWALCSLTHFYVRTSAQSIESEWSDPLTLSALTGVTGWDPKISSDRSGTVHVIWGAWFGSEPPGAQAANRIIYTRLVDGIWSEPLDILISPTPDDQLFIGDLSVSPSGLLVVSWVANGQLLISKANAESAIDAASWQTQNIDSQSTRPLVAIDKQNDHWFVTYVKNNAFVQLIKSTDLGATWESPVTIWSVGSENTAPFNGTAIVSDNGKLHMAWDVHDADRSWNSIIIMNASIDTTSFSNINVREVARSGESDPTIAWPSIATDAENTVHLVWNNGVGSRIGRQYQFSSDSGITWSSISPIHANELSGQTGNPSLAIDSDQKLHLITSARGPDNATAIRYTYLQEKEWSRYESLWPELHPGEHPDTAVTNGNRLHLVWNDYLNGAVIYTTRELDAEWIPSTPFIDQVSYETVPEPVKLNPQQDTANDLSNASAEPDYEFDRTANVQSMNTSRVLLFGVIPVVLLVLIAGVITLRRR